jgi:hypothetical protein
MIPTFHPATTYALGEAPYTSYILLDICILLLYNNVFDHRFYLFILSINNNLKNKYDLLFEIYLRP